MSRLSVANVYNSYGKFYDLFDIFFRRRIAKALAPIPFQPGDRVLDIGVGTGFSLRHYPSYVHVTGIDNSIRMLARASRKVDEGRVRADAQLVLADAVDLPFPDKKFDVVVLSHTISTVADPHRCLMEALRVTREHGILVMVNHFRSTSQFMRRIEDAFDPLCRRLGWRTDLSLADLLARAGVRYPSLAEQSRGLVFQIVYVQKSGQSSRVVALPQPTEFDAQFNPA